MAPSRKRKIEQLEEALKATRHQLAREQLRTFEAAKQSRRTEFWHAPLTGANSDLRPVWARLISRHRDLVDNNPWAERAIRAFQNNFIGDGDGHSGQELEAIPAVLPRVVGVNRLRLPREAEFLRAAEPGLSYRASVWHLLDPACHR